MSNLQEEKYIPKKYTFRENVKKGVEENDKI